MTKILAHTHLVEIQSFCKVNEKFQRFFVVFLYTAPYKRKPSSGAKSCAYRCISCCANPLLSSELIHLKFIFPHVEAFSKIIHRGCMDCKHSSPLYLTDCASLRLLLVLGRRRPLGRFLVSNTVLRYTMMPSLYSKQQNQKLL